ncbi:MAG TPA: DinB family protein, partial [Gemmatimonadaceae bacterium]
YEQADVEEALADFERLRNSTLRLLEQTSVAERQRVGLHSERGEESIEQMILNQAGHDIVHLRQIARIRDAIKRSSTNGA